MAELFSHNHIIVLRLKGSDVMSDGQSKINGKVTLLELEITGVLFIVITMKGEIMISNH